MIFFHGKRNLVVSNPTNIPWKHGRIFVRFSFALPSFLSARPNETTINHLCRGYSRNLFRSFVTRMFPLFSPPLFLPCIISFTCVRGKEEDEGEEEHRGGGGPFILAGFANFNQRTSKRPHSTFPPRLANGLLDQGRKGSRTNRNFVPPPLSSQRPSAPPLLLLLPSNSSRIGWKKLEGK